MRVRLALLALALGVLWPIGASAFCGFYVGGADSKLYNNATQVVLMREGTRTVLSMQNNYEGPPQDFAMVVPVPVVLKEEHVKTLPSGIFERVDKIAAPRLVEYWEQDPCPDPQTRMREEEMMAPPSPDSAGDGEGDAEDEPERSVKVEAKFAVGEYDIVILSAEDSGGLDRWLKKYGYNIPAGAEPVLRPYVAQGSKFFVAKVNQKKVRRVNGRVTLSPLRFHYDTVNFTLPVRLGLLNSKGKQDLIVHILARKQRYEVANYRNVTVPTNIDVSDATRERFGEFYAALFDRVMAKFPKSVVTEYSWASGTCDPCPTDPLQLDDLVTLGADVMPDLGTDDDEIDEDIAYQVQGDFVLTRLHTRYSKDTLSSDLVFRKARPIVGGREIMDGDQLRRGARIADGGQNNFQARYVIRHAWEGPIECENPQRGVWGGPPNGHSNQLVVARDTAFAPRGNLALESFVQTDVPQLGLLTSAGKNVDTAPVVAKRGACGACHVGQPDAGALYGFGALALGIGLLRRRRRG